MISFVDVKRAHCRSPATRLVYVELPEELGHGKDKVGQLKQSMYGCRDAGYNWEMTIFQFFTKKLGFKQGASSPCVYYHPQRDIRTTVHGDDFTTLASREQLEWLHAEMSAEWEIVVRHILGPPWVPNVDSQAVILNRLVTWDQEGITWEADPRHAELIIEACGVTGNKVTTPSAREKPEAAEETYEDLCPERVHVYRSTTMRAAFLSQDRPDLQQAVRVLAKGMSRPNEQHWQALKRLARYLRYWPRLVQRFPNQGAVRELEYWVDADHAGCIRTRKSTSGGVGMLGKACIRTYSKGQAVISLSSGESEYYSLVSGISNLLGDASLALDWGIRFICKVWMDATAGIAIGSRRGLGRVKHIDTVFLWCQQIVTDGRVKVGKKATTEMLADILTKPVSEEIMNRMLATMGFQFESGKHALAKTL